MKYAVYCGSSYGKKEIYENQAGLLGKALVKHNIELVYGGGKSGIMGVVADAVVECGGKSIGVITSFLDEREGEHPNLSELFVVDSMHERKAMMADFADGFIVFPGGPGTMDEFFEVYTWAQLSLHKKPCAILNVDHYYDPLLAFIKHMCDEDFLDQATYDMLIVESDIDILLDKMIHYKAPEIHKTWEQKY